MKEVFRIMLLICSFLPLRSIAFSCHESPIILGLKQNAVFKEGVNLSIRLKFYDHARIESITMYLNNQPVRTITQHPTLVPFDWSGDLDPELANMEVGNYATKFEIHDKCGNVYTASRHFKVAKLEFVVSPYVPWPWLKKLMQTNPQAHIAEYRLNGQTLIQASPCGNSASPVIWFAADGRTVARFGQKQPQGSYSAAKLVKIIAKPCG